jgi:tetratricopeptide (TPR) repeat protein
MPMPSRITPDRAVLAGALLAALAYIQDIRYDFILDDVPLILMNNRITSLRNWKSLFVTDLFEMRHAKATMEMGGLLYRPIYRLWQMLNAQLFGVVVPWWHVTSLLLHVGVIFLVYRLGIQLLKDRWTAALAAALFAAHPIHAESVVYVTASTDLLVTLFALASFLAYFRFREEGASPIYYIASIFAAALAMLSKETAAMVPWLLVAYEAIRETLPGTPRQSRRRFAWTLPFFGVVGAYAGVRAVLFGFSAGTGPGGDRIATFLDMPLVLIAYLRNLFWPFRLSFFYPAEWGSHWTLVRGISCLAALAVAGYLWNRFRDRPELRLQLLWAAILPLPALLVVYSFVRENWVHDRHMYLVSVPICLIAAALLADLQWHTKYSVIASVGIVAILLVSLAIQVPRFSDDATIYASALKVAPRSFLAHSYHGEALWNYGRKDEGLREFKFAAELSPQSSNAHERYGAALAELGRDDEARAEYETALHCAPGPAESRAFLLAEAAQLELRHSEFSEAAAHLREAVHLAPQTLNYHALLAEALRQQGRVGEAGEEMQVEATIRRRVAQEQRASVD